jgi:hypothetical protein
MSSLLKPLASVASVDDPESMPSNSCPKNLAESIPSLAMDICIFLSRLTPSFDSLQVLRSCLSRGLLSVFAYSSKDAYLMKSALKEVDRFRKKIVIYMFLFFLFVVRKKKKEERKLPTDAYYNTLKSLRVK